MMKIRYDNLTGKITGWRSDISRAMDKRAGQTIVELDVSVPHQLMEALLFDKVNKKLIPNPDYIEPEPTRDLAAEIDELRASMGNLKAR